MLNPVGSVCFELISISNSRGKLISIFHGAIIVPLMSFSRMRCKRIHVVGLFRRKRSLRHGAQWSPSLPNAKVAKTAVSLASSRSIREIMAGIRGALCRVVRILMDIGREDCADTVYKYHVMALAL